MNSETCGRCRHFTILFGEKRGECYGPPPVMDASGACPAPRVFPSRHACGLFVSIPQGAQAEVRVKHQPDTPGRAAQLRREDRKVVAV
jgi:hypothetical protein